MSAENLPCKALKAVEAASRKWRKTLTVDSDGVGRFDSTCCRQAQRDFEAAIEEAAEIHSDTVPEIGLLRGMG